MKHDIGGEGGPQRRIRSHGTESRGRGGLRGGLREMKNCDMPRGRALPAWLGPGGVAWLSWLSGTLLSAGKSQLLKKAPTERAENRSSHKTTASPGTTNQRPSTQTNKCKWCEVLLFRMWPRPDVRFRCAIRAQLCTMYIHSTDVQCRK